MSLGVIIGIGITIFLLAYIMFKLKTEVDDSTGENKQNHFILQLILLFFIVGLLALMGKATMDNSKDCSWLIANQTVSGNTTIFNNEYVCSDSITNTGLNFYKAIMWAVRIIYLYIFGYIVFEVLKYLGWVVPK